MDSVGTQAVLWTVVLMTLPAFGLMALSALFVGATVVQAAAHRLSAKLSQGRGVQRSRLNL